MIVRIHSSGKSFKGAAAYLTHDPKAETADRVGWTHTLNLAHDHVPSAVDEMLWTARDAELLKQEAGIRAGGRATENPVKHVSLNWAIEDKPTREHMIETAEDFLNQMRWGDHQAVIVAHTDKEFSHVHLLINAIHPETGLKLDEAFDHRRASEWALEYERSQENIRCENRLKDEKEREDAPTRPAWMAFKGAEKSFDEKEKILAAQELDFSIEPENRQKKEWARLKEIQRDERVRFFAEGKIEFKELRADIYREIREEFREPWADFYAAKKNGADPEILKEMKAELIRTQNAVLEERRDLACQELRESRDGHYQELLSGQRDLRLGLHARQAAGLDSLELIDHFTVDHLKGAERPDAPRQDDWTESERPGVSGHQIEIEETRSGSYREASHNLRPAGSIAGDFGIGAGLAVASFLGSIADGLCASKPAPKAERDLFSAAASEARDKAARDEEFDEKKRHNERSSPQP